MLTRGHQYGDETVADMGMQEAVRAVFGKYAELTGRARRPEYWWFVLFVALVGLVLTGVEGLVMHRAMGSYGFLSGLWNLATFLPALGVSIRRLHDVDRSGWWLLIAFVPVIGVLVLLYWYVQKGTEGTNQFGAEP
jgi:uncharacterized membrane protein YhaH (DUF805 family)